MTQIHITSTATAQERLRVSQRLTRNWASVPRRILPFVLIVAGSLFAGAGVGWVLGVAVSSSVLVSLYGMMGAALGLGLTRLINGPVQMKQLMRSEILNGPSPMVLDARGVTLSERSFTWAQLDGVMHSPEGILLLGSQADGILIPVRDLPDGLTAQDVLAQLNRWKAAQ